MNKNNCEPECEQFWSEQFWSEQFWSEQFWSEQFWSEQFEPHGWNVLRHKNLQAQEKLELASRPALQNPVRPVLTSIKTTRLERTPESLISEIGFSTKSLARTSVRFKRESCGAGPIRNHQL
jgi:transketolase